MERFVLGLLARQEVGGQAQLVGDSLRGQDMQVGELIGVLGKVVPLHEALFFEGSHAVVGLAKAHAERPR